MMEKRVLVVDDSSTVRQQVALALSEAGFTTLEAADGREGLNKLEAGLVFDLVVCDVSMPGMDGLEMVERVKAKPRYKTLPIVMLTTEGDPALIRRARAAGAAGWMVKPFSVSQLVTAARHLTRR